MRALAAFLALLFATTITSTSHGEEVVAIYAGGNTISFDGGFPSDFEAGGTARASLSPHVSAVGGLFYGVGRSYLRSSVGARITATDVNNPDMSIGLGMSFQACTESSIRPQEWTPEVAIGWRPYPAKLPRLVLGASAQYGLDSNSAALLLAARWHITSF